MVKRTKTNKKDNNAIAKTKVKDIALNQLYPLTRKNWRKIK